MSKHASDIFEINAGVKRGDPLSPVLYILFINDILETLSNENMMLPWLSMILVCLCCSMWTTQETLQNMLNRLHAYSSILGLKVNIDKTKIMIFEKVVNID